MSLSKYRAFLTAVEYGSITKAAEVLGYTQPAVSHMIASLEKEFGVTLLFRAKDGVSPTEDAKTFIFYIRQIINSEDKYRETAKKIANVETGLLRIGSFPSIALRWFPGILSEFRRLHPGINVQLYEGAHVELSQYLAEGKIDIAFMSTPIPEGFLFQPLKRDPICAVLPKKHPLTLNRRVALSDLANFPLILPPEQIDLDIWKVVHSEGLQPQALIRIQGDHTIIELVGRGLGISLMPRLAIAPPLGKVTIRRLMPNYTRTLGIAMHSLEYASPSMREFFRITNQMMQ